MEKKGWGGERRVEKNMEKKWKTKERKEIVIAESKPMKASLLFYVFWALHN